MRWLIGVVVLLALAPQALADDSGLRGSQTVGPATFTRWSGFYFGGEVGYSAASADFANATQALIAYGLRNTALESQFSPSGWPVLGSDSSGKPTFGGFVGYNTQWQDLVLGIEGNFTMPSLGPLNAPSSQIARTTPADTGGNIYNLTMNGTGSLTNLEYGTLRTRAGWILGNFLPYGFVGVAVGTSDTSVAVAGAGSAIPAPTAYCGVTNTPPCTPVPFGFVESAARTSMMVGFAVGGGLDVAVTSNLFVRGEFEFVEFAPAYGIAVSVSSARVGAGIKF